jgi:hypothetical protein
MIILLFIIHILIEVSNCYGGLACRLDNELGFVSLTVCGVILERIFLGLPRAFITIILYLRKCVQNLI